MDLTDDDVLEILKLFEQSKFDFLHLEHGDRKITISKPGYGPPAGSAAAPAIPSQARTADAASKSGSEVAPKPAGTVEQILVTNGASVEYGQPLFFIRPEA